VRNWLLTTEAKQVETYRGLAIHADQGLHSQMLALLEKHVAPGSRVLDVGAGSGAFSRRLQDHGYKVIATDIDPRAWRASSVPFLATDAAHGLAERLDEPFDAVCCLEVMEHVENPWQLAREFARLLCPGGIALISTPNVGSFLSRVRFLRTGRFHQFDERDCDYGHVRPITDLEMRTLLQRAGFEVREVVAGGYLPVFDLSSLRPKALAANLLRGLAYLLARGPKTGWVLVFVAEKIAGQPSSQGG